MTITDRASWSLDAAEEVATDAAVAHASALGLLELIDRFRFRDASDPIPAPGTADLPDVVRTHALDAMHGAASCRILVDDLISLQEGAGRPDLDEQTDALARTIGDASDRAQTAALAAHRALRHLAQVGLGVAQHAWEDDEVELLERTTIGVLTGRGTGTAASNDRLPLTGRTRLELSVELAGLIARMLCDQSSNIDPPSSFVITADGMPDLVVTIDVNGGVDVAGVQHFPGPVTITEVTALVLERVADADALDRCSLQWPSFFDPGTMTWVQTFDDLTDPGRLEAFVTHPGP